MARIRESLLAAIFALSAPWAAADSITVNTTTDDFANNSLCSLREAVEYFNRGKPAAGFQGCVSPAHDNYASITIPANTQPYLITNGPITVRTDLIITGAGRTKDTVTTLQVQGAHRAFIVNDNPQYVAPRCATATPGCASSPSTFDLDPSSDLGVPGDYLTTTHSPQFNGQLPGVSTTPLPNDSYVIRIYDNPATGTPVMIGQTLVPFSSSPISWSVRSTYVATDGLHHFTYTTQVVDGLTNSPLGVESAQSTDQVWVAIYTAPYNRTVHFSQMIINGGCASISGCAESADDNTVINNDPVATNTSYDTYGLSYTNGLTGTTGNGGIFFNNENLTLSNLLVQNGEAANGGAVFNTALGVLSVDTTELRANRADAGAAILSTYNGIGLSTSLLTENVVNTPSGSGAVVQVLNATSPNGVPGSLVSNATISGNTGRALSLHLNSFVNAATIVLNSGGGLDFNGEDVGVYNTILAGNANLDCQNAPATPSMATDLVLVSGGCPSSGNQVVDDVAGTPGQLMATLVNGKCESDFGLLCPLADHGAETFVHMPHILPSYASDPLLLGASPIINKGSTTIGTTVSSCPSQDQRGKTRTIYACDIGAVEMQGVGATEVTRSGGVIKWGQTFTEYLGDDLADEELLTPALCPAGVMLTLSTVPALYPPSSIAPDPTRVVANTYRSDVPGCPWIERQATRGTVSFDTGGNYHYAPSSNFHGFDTFDMRVVTSLSFLNSLPADRSHIVGARVIVEPNTTMTSSKLGGGVDPSSLLLVALLGLGWRRGGRQ
ncbi:MAG TPA: CSLREA domain-containing protein [Moraxellaceae bacterium]|nr:CSLREA domain-containing protein [Moraxellaceae bacterium]